MDTVKPTASNQAVSDDPPAYDDIADWGEDSDIDGGDDDDDDLLEEPEVILEYIPTSRAIKHPIVIPQTTKSFQGTFYSPFVRAYAPELESHGITQKHFLAFLDGLNEAYVTHPVFEGLGIARNVFNMFRELYATKESGADLRAISEAMGTTALQTRTQIYVTTMNRDLFRPVGLNLNIMATTSMIQKINYPRDRLELPPLEWTSDVTSIPDADPKGSVAAFTSPVVDDTRMQYLKMMDGYISPLTLDVPNTSGPDELFERLSAAQALRSSVQQERKSTRREQRAKVRAERKHARGERRHRRKEAKLEVLEQARQRSNVAYDAATRLATSNSPAPTKVLQRLEKSRYKLDRKIARLAATNARALDRSSRRADRSHAKSERQEARAAQKIRWIVISRYEGDEDSDVDSIPGDEHDGLSALKAERN